MTEPTTPEGAGLPDAPIPAQVPPADVPAPEPDALAAPPDPPLEGSPGYGLPIGMGGEPAAPEAASDAATAPDPGTTLDPAAGSDPAGSPAGDLSGYEPAAPSSDPGAYQGAIPGGPGDASGGWTPGAVPGTDLAAAATIAPPAKKGGRAIRVVGIVVLLVLVIGAVVYFTKGQKSASDLTVGDCFEVPSATTDIDTVKSGPCNESHTGEIFFIANYPDASAYPSDSDFEQFAEDQCNPVYTTYVGASLDTTPDLTVGFFYPQSDGWASGDRVVKCYVTRQDGGPMTKSMKGSGGN